MTPLTGLQEWLDSTRGELDGAREALSVTQATVAALTTELGNAQAALQRQQAEFASYIASQSPTIGESRCAALDYSSDRSPERAAMLARFPLAILSYGASRPDHLAAVREANPRIKLARYVKASEWKNITTQYDVMHTARLQIDANNWWLRTASGKLTQQMGQEGQYDVHHADWYPWKAAHDGPTVQGFDAIFVDNVVASTRAPADWNRSGTFDLAAGTAAANAAYCGGYGVYLAELLRLYGLPLIGNVETKPNFSPARPEYKGKLRWGYVEGITGASFSPAEPVETILLVQASGITPIAAVRGDTPEELLYGLCIGLMADGLTSMLPRTTPAGFKSRYDAPLIWMPEFDLRIGQPEGPAYKTGAIWRRDYANARVVVDTAARSGRIERV